MTVPTVQAGGRETGQARALEAGCTAVGGEMHGVPARLCQCCSREPLCTCLLPCPWQPLVGAASSNNCPHATAQACPSQDLDTSHGHS